MRGIYIIREKFQLLMQSAGCLSPKQLQFIFSNIPLFTVLNWKLLESLLDFPSLGSY